VVEPGKEQSGEGQLEEPMELTISEAQAKMLLKEVVIELVQEKRELFFEFIVEAMEEIGLANAIREGRQNEFVSEKDVYRIFHRRLA